MDLVTENLVAMISKWREWKGKTDRGLNPAFIKQKLVRYDASILADAVQQAIRRRIITQTEADELM